MGKVASFEGGRLVVEAALQAELGDSVAIDGVCLTVVENGGGRLAFDVVPETLDQVKPFGDRVNLEPALRAGDPLGGHYVQGHVDGVGRVASVAPEADGVRVRIEPPAELLRYLVDKGSVAVEGVSLTVRCRRDRLRDRADPARARGDDALRARCRERCQPRARRAGQVRRETAPPLAGGASRPAGQPPATPDADRGTRLSESVRPYCPLRSRTAVGVPERERAPRYDGPVTMTADTRTESPFATVEEAIEEIRAGRFVVVVDDEDPRTRATSRSRRSSRRRRRSASWSRTRAGSSASA